MATRLFLPSQSLITRIPRNALTSVDFSQSWSTTNNSRGARVLSELSVGRGFLSARLRLPLGLDRTSVLRSRTSRTVTVLATSEAPGSDSFDDGGPKSRALALGSVSAAVGLFLFARLAGATPDLSILAAESVPYDRAMVDSRPAMVEFYADWCEVCQEMARDVRKVENKFKDNVNFVMINIEDPKYVEELDEFGVDGIPHFVFLDKDKNEQGFVVGRLPKRILTENLTALANGEPAIPHSQLVGTTSHHQTPNSTTGSSVEASPDAQVASATADLGPNTGRGGSAPSSGSSVFDTPIATVAQAPVFDKSLYSFDVDNIKGERVSLEQYRGKVSLVVNVASKCGLTDSNYKELTQLYSQYKDQGLEILAFPCNQFFGQEPGSNEQIESFACSRYKATYPIFSKIDVNGPRTAPLYKFLKTERGNGKDISWNFEKFLVDKEGRVVKRFAPTVSPLSLQDDIKALLDA